MFRIVLFFRFKASNFLQLVSELSCIIDRISELIVNFDADLDLIGSKFYMDYFAKSKLRF